ncbi:pilus assembly protein PilP [Chiayiivirga flava]|uniref:Type IV pilus assembly protein PilP n=1 Tax=Chiayiivirga flava TaxID=659595 RepID=A0A7W8D9M0_9GAMM|nr:pilus assembly protein PilP [Chiayiivirga flava]MBB5209312.1 type IV pilus assembly protein PilP [Chiayiivirga flava]
MSGSVKQESTRVKTPMRSIATVLALLVLAGCSSGRADLERWVADKKAEPPLPLEPLPVMKQFETFEYAAQDLRDPFSMPTEEQETQAGSSLRPDPERRKEPLEAFPLDGLDMVGTLGEGDSLLALVMDPDRVIHRVTVGNYMGQSDGRVTGVFEDRIELVELESDGASGWIERRATVALGDE